MSTKPPATDAAEVMESKPELDIKPTSRSSDDKQSSSDVDPWDLVDEDDDVVKWAGRLRPTVLCCDVRSFLTYIAGRGVHFPQRHETTFPQVGPTPLPSSPLFSFPASLLFPFPPFPPFHRLFNSLLFPRLKKIQLGV